VRCDARRLARGFEGGERQVSGIYVCDVLIEGLVLIYDG